MDGRDGGERQCARAREIKMMKLAPCDKPSTSRSLALCGDMLLTMNPIHSRREHVHKLSELWGGGEEENH